MSVERPPIERVTGLAGIQTLLCHDRSRGDRLSPGCMKDQRPFIAP
jgi:hypothetical protein